MRDEVVEPDEVADDKPLLTGTYVVGTVAIVADVDIGVLDVGYVSTTIAGYEGAEGFF